jgi:hypothetical protein
MTEESTLEFEQHREYLEHVARGSASTCCGRDERIRRAMSGTSS